MVACGTHVKRTHGNVPARDTENQSTTSSPGVLGVHRDDCGKQLHRAQAGRQQHRARWYSKRGSWEISTTGPWLTRLLKDCMFWEGTELGQRVNGYFYTSPLTEGTATAKNTK